MKQLFSLTVLLLVFFLITKAQPGSLDTSFGEAGKSLTTQFQGESHAIITQTDGKIITVGRGNNLSQSVYSWIVSRFNSDGSLDYSFGDSGKVITTGAELGAKGVDAFSLAIQPDNKIIAVGYFFLDYPRGNDIGIVRYNVDGSLDKTFGINGIVITDLGLNDYGGDITIQKDGKILIIGGSKDIATNKIYPFITRYLANGSLDESFGINGIIYNGFDRSVELGAVAIHEDGKILTAGLENAGRTNNYLLAQYLTNGIRDSSFGENGISRLLFNGNEGRYSYIYDMIIQPDSKIVVGGVTGTDHYLMTVARFDMDGKVDSGFGINGYVVTQDKRSSSTANSVMIQENNKIVIAGGSSYKDTNNFIALRFTSEGLLDSSFGESGIATTKIIQEGGGSCGAIQKDGKILVAGTLYFYDTENIAMVRYLGDPTNPRPTITQIKRWIRNHILHFEDDNTNAAYYVIEKSTATNIGFVPVTKITANATITNYSYSLPEAATQSTYRIKAVNKDNSITYSSPISSSDPAKAGVASFKVYPNPAKDRINVETAGTVQLRLQNSNGRVLLTQTVNGKGSIDINKLPNGVYYVVNTINGESLKVVKE